MPSSFLIGKSRKSMNLKYSVLNAVLGLAWITPSVLAQRATTTNAACYMSVDQINWNIDSEIGRLWIPNSKQLPVAISIINESGINFQEVNTYLSVLLSSAYSSFLRCSGGKSERTLPETRAGSGFQPIIAQTSPWLQCYDCTICLQFLETTP